MIGDLLSGVALGISLVLLLLAYVFDTSPKLMRQEITACEIKYKQECKISAIPKEETFSNARN